MHHPSEVDEDSGSMGSGGTRRHMNLRWHRTFKRRELLGYATAILAVAMAVLGHLQMETRWKDSAPVSLFLVAVIVSAWVGGTKPGLLAITLSVVGFDHFVLPQETSATFGVEVVRMLALVAVAAYVLWVTATERGAADAIRQAHDELRRNNAALREENRERERAEATLRRSERRLLEAEELGRTGSWEHDLVSGQIFSSDENLRLFYGSNSDKGARFEDYIEAIHPDDRAYVAARGAKLHEEGGRPEIEFRVVWPDGRVRVLFGRATVVHDASGKAVRVYGTNVDITERKCAEDAVRESQQLLKQVLATLPVGVAVTDRSGNIVLANAATKQIWGADPVVSGPQRWVESKGYRHDSGEAIAPTDWASVHALSEGKTTVNELIDIEAFNGEYKTIQNSSAPIRDADGQIVGAVIVNEDVTERVQANDALHESANRLRHLSRRLLTVQEEERRHLSRELHDEFGQLLTALSMHLYAAKSLVGEAAQSRLDECMGVLKDAIAQVRLLALELRPTMLDTAGLDSTLRWLAEQHQQRTGIATQVAGHVRHVPGDVAIACFRVVQEALTNIVRHARAQRIWIELSQRPEALELIVRDDGLGFDVGAALERAASGAHLGLLGMRERAQVLGGRLQIDSEPGQGTRIRISLPCAGPIAVRES